MSSLKATTPERVAPHVEKGQPFALFKPDWMQSFITKENSPLP